MLNFLLSRYTKPQYVELFVISNEFQKYLNFTLTFDVCMSHYQKSATFRFDKSAKSVNNNGPKPGKNNISLLNLLQKYRKMLNCSTRYSLIFFKFEFLKIA